MDNARLIKILGGHYGMRLQHWWEERGLPRGEARDLRVTYAGRFAAAMDAADFGPDNGRFSSYLNCLSGVTAYAMARERGLSVEEGIACYDYLAKPLRGFLHGSGTRPTATQRVPPHSGQYPRGPHWPQGNLLGHRGYSR